MKSIWSWFCPRPNPSICSYRPYVNIIFIDFDQRHRRIDRHRQAVSFRCGVSENTSEMEDNWPTAHVWLKAQFAVYDYPHNSFHIIRSIMNKNRKTRLAYVNTFCLSMLGCVHCARLCFCAVVCIFARLCAVSRALCSCVEGWDSRRRLTCIPQKLPLSTWLSWHRWFSARL